MPIELAMFPLELVVFPEEKLALHIFEERYKQLIYDCEQDKIRFGIPSFINKEMNFGTEVRLSRVVNSYKNGAKDIVCEGLRIFKIKEFYPNWNKKLYAGATIEYLSNLEDATKSQQKRFVNLVRELYSLLDVAKDPINSTHITSYTLAHKIGLSLEQELEFIKITSEADRFAFLIDHLSVTIPVLKEINKTKEKIKMNGHFKNFDPLDFSDYKINKD